MLIKATYLLNLASAVILMMTGWYINIAFASQLPVSGRAVILISAVAYFLFRVGQGLPQEKVSKPASRHVPASAKYSLDFDV